MLTPVEDEPTQQATGQPQVAAAPVQQQQRKFKPKKAVRSEHKPSRKEIKSALSWSVSLFTFGAVSGAIIPLFLGFEDMNMLLVCGGFSLGFGIFLFLLSTPYLLAASLRAKYAVQVYESGLVLAHDGEQHQVPFQHVREIQEAKSKIVGMGGTIELHTLKLELHEGYGDSITFSHGSITNFTKFRTTSPSSVRP